MGISTCVDCHECVDCSFLLYFARLACMRDDSLKFTNLCDYEIFVDYLDDDGAAVEGDDGDGVDSVADGAGTLNYEVAEVELLPQAKNVSRSRPKVVMEVANVKNAEEVAEDVFARFRKVGKLCVLHKIVSEEVGNVDCRICRNLPEEVAVEKINVHREAVAFGQRRTTSYRKKNEAVVA